jgi:hypothetical protein
MYWYPGVADGGTPLLDYRVWYTVQGGEFTVLLEQTTDTTFVATGLTTGISYEFKVQARNAFGYSDFSNSVLILVASVPSKPSAPVTTWSDANDQITVSWTAPNNNGAPILSYQILIRAQDGTTFAEESTNCNGSQEAVIASQTCIIDVLNLRNPPFSLEWGSHVYAKLRATNVKGSSTVSNLGDGGFIVTFADPPTNFVEDLTVKSPSTIGLDWTEAPFNGGESVDNYRIYIQEEG